MSSFGYPYLGGIYGSPYWSGIYGSPYWNGIYGNPLFNNYKINGLLNEYDELNDLAIKNNAIYLQNLSENYKECNDCDSREFTGNRDFYVKSLELNNEINILYDVLDRNNIPRPKLYGMDCSSVPRPMYYTDCSGIPKETNAELPQNDIPLSSNEQRDFNTNHYPYQHPNFYPPYHRPPFYPPFHHPYPHPPFQRPPIHYPYQYPPIPRPPFYPQPYVNNTNT